jgi:glutamine synthetase
MPTRRRRKATDAPEAERLLQAKLPAHLVKALRMLALEQDTTVKELLTRLVEEYVAQQRRTSGGKG